jgi:hypothetical protein
MSKQVTRLPTGMNRPIESVKKSLRRSVDLVIESENEEAIRVMEQFFEYMFKNIYLFRTLMPTNSSQEKGEVVPIKEDGPSST